MAASALRRTAVGLLAVSAAVFFTQRHLPTLPVFTMSDLYYFFANPNTWDLGEWRSLFSSAYDVKFCNGGFYHPLPYLLYMATSELFGHEPLAFRCLQIGLLWTTAVLLAVVERRRLGAWGWLAAVIFVLLPMHVDLGIVAVRDQLVVLFFLIGLELHRGGPPAGRGRTVALAGVYAAALLSKELAVIFPVILLADDRLAVRRPAASRFAALGLVLLAYAVFRSQVLADSASAVSRLSLGYASGESPAALLGRIAETAARVAQCGPSLWASGVFFAGIVLIALASGRGSYFYAAWVAGAFLFYSGLLPIRNLSELIVRSHDERHRLFLPGVGFAWLAALALRESKGRWQMLLPGLYLAAILFGAARQYGLDHRVPGYGMPAGPSWEGFLPALSFRRRHEPGSVRTFTAAIAATYGPKAKDIQTYFEGVLDDPCRSVYLLRTGWARDAQEYLARIDAGLAYQRGDYRGALALDPSYAEAHRKLGDREQYEAILRRETYLQNARCAWP